MLDALEQLVDSLLYEGYALYPYTPGATKNATPTPFGIVYPPVYAATLTSTFDHLELRCVLHAPAGRGLTPRCASWRPTASATRRAQCGRAGRRVGRRARRTRRRAQARVGTEALRRRWTSR